MAGVFRAKSCLRCRARKKRCDRGQPKCTACQTNSVACIYQQRPDVTFVQHTAPTCPKAGKGKIHEAERVITAYDQSFARSARAEQLQGAFWSAYLPLGEGQSELATTFAVSSRVARLQDLTNDPHSPGRLALDACILTNLGRRNWDLVLLQQGMQAYGKAIARIHREIRSPGEHSRISLVPACRLLCLYEMMRLSGKDPLSSQGSDWRKHVRATCHLVDELVVTQGEDRAICEEVAHLAFRENFTRRRPDSRAHADWRSLPVFADTDTFRDLRGLLHRSMAALPPLLQRSDELLQARPDDSSSPNDEEHAIAVELLVDSLLELDKSLRDWEFLVSALHREDQSSSRISKSLALLGVDVGSDLLSICRSHGYGFLLAVNEYWATRLVIGFQVQHLLSRYGYTPSESSELQQDLWPFISHVAHSTPILLSPEAGLYVAEQSVYAIATTIHTLAALGGLQSEEMKLIKTTIARVKGPAFTHDFLKSMAADSVAEELQGDMDVGEDAVRMGLKWYG